MKNFTSLNNPKVSSGHVECSFDAPPDILFQNLKTFAEESEKLGLIKSFWKCFFFTNFPKKVNVKFWFKWMLKFNFPPYLLGSFFHQGLSRHPFTWRRVFKWRNFHVFLCPSLHRRELSWDWDANVFSLGLPQFFLFRAQNFSTYSMDFSGFCSNDTRLFQTIRYCFWIAVL